MKINPTVVNCAKALFNNPFKNKAFNKKTETTIFSCVGIAALEAVQYVKAKKNNDDVVARDRMLDGFTFLAGAAGGMCGIGGAIIASLGFHLLAEENKQYMV